MPSWLRPTELFAFDRPLRPMAHRERGSGRPVVLLHGQPGDGHDWDRVVAALEGRVRAIVPDRPGYGRTGGPAGTISANADAVCELLDRLGLARATVAGFSWGGAVALDLAQRHPERVEALVLVSAVGGAGSVDDLDRLLAMPLLGPVASLGGLMALRAERVRRIFAPSHAPLDPSAVDRLPDGWLASWRSFVVEERALVRELPALTSSLSTRPFPTTVMVGALDRVVRPHSQRDLARRLSAEVVDVPGCGHLLTLEVPAQVARVIEDVAPTSGAR